MTDEEIDQWAKTVIEIEARYLAAGELSGEERVAILAHSLMEKGGLEEGMALKMALLIEYFVVSAVLRYGESVAEDTLKQVLEDLSFPGWGSEMDN